MNKELILTVLVLLVANFAKAQNLNDTLMIDEVIVTGYKTEIARKLVPISVSQISKQSIENSGETNILPAISALSPGVFVTERNILGFGVATGSAGSITIRGISSSPNTSTLILIDGHPQYQGIFGHPLPDAYVASDVEKVEVIRGPASILYGSNAMSGVMNIITKKQNKDGFTANLGASYGSYNTQKYNGTVGYKKNKISIFASLNHDQTDGIRDNTDFNITNGYTKIGYRINDNFSLTGDFNIAKFNANDNGPVYAEEPQPFNINILRGKTALSLENKHNKVEGALKLYHNFGKHDLSDGWYSTDHNSGTMLYQTLSLFKGNKLTAGVDAKQFGGIGNIGKAADSLILVNELAAYTYMQQNLFQKLLLSAGLRIENNEIYGNELVPMAGLNYYPTDKTTIKSSVSKGFRSPTIMEMYLFAPNPELKPEYLWNYEIGWLQQFFGGRLNTELTVFMAQAENIIQVTGQYPNVIRENVGKFTNKGIETSMKLKATGDLFLQVNYSYLNLSKALIAAPEHQINLSADYTYKILNANLSVQHIQNLYTSVIPEKKQSYTLLNLRISANIFKKANIFVSGNNLLNQKYEINYGYPMPEINFTGGFNLKF
ncbi:MAG: TonB-dependent receptor [Bacteroidota bacterium]|nr:TonB-dependent receptor [Bacteroidota bacterium]